MTANVIPLRLEPPQCMGGWCRTRDRCGNYLAEQRPGREPAERLCGKVEKPTPVRVQERASC